MLTASFLFLVVRNENSWDICFYHDAAAALIEDGKVVYAAQEERFTRIKNDASFPENAIRFCIKEACITLEQIDYIAFYDKPFLKFERLLETYYAYAPKGFLSFAKAMPIWLKEKLFTKQLIQKRLKRLNGGKKVKMAILFPEHHLSHAASAFYTSPFAKSAFLTVDGVGEWATTTFGMADGSKGFQIMGELHFPHSLGLFYSSFTYFLGFKVNAGEYKMMGLAPYAVPNSARVQKFIEIIKSQLITIKTDGSFKLNLSYFNFPVGSTMVLPNKWEVLFGFRKRKAEDKLSQIHADLALAAQKVTEEVLVLLITHVKKITKASNLCLAGGVFLNCVANSVLFEKGLFSDIHIQPAAGDAGGALGAGLAAAYLKQPLVFKGMSHPYKVYLGPKYYNQEIERNLKNRKLTFRFYQEEKNLCKAVAGYLAADKVVGWYQGRTEFGPRALGNRSILASASNPEMQTNLNLKIKFRESFRPFAPAVCVEDYTTYFEAGNPSSYMLFTSSLKPSLCFNLDSGFQDLSLEEKRAIPKSKLPAITHIDYSARVQAVSKEFNARFWQLIQDYKLLTGIGVIVNTSFNVKDEPIVNTPEDAIDCFLKTNMDILVLENYVIEK